MFADKNLIHKQLICNNLKVNLLKWADNSHQNRLIINEDNDFEILEK